MRMRFKPYARAELLAADFHIHDPFHLQGQIGRASCRERV